MKIKNLKCSKRGYLQISFAWLFAIIVGAVILFLAIYASTKIIQSEQGIQSAKTGKEIGIILNPLETGLESVKATSITFPVETRIYNNCNNQGYFGRQLIQISQKSFNKWTKTDIDVGFSNKYIFSMNPSEGKEFSVFTKPFDLPFKVADLIYVVSLKKEYCFVDAPENIKEEISNIKRKNILSENCSTNSIRVCFSTENCDINVDYLRRYVEKSGKFQHFNNDALMYGAIFSDKENYECQLKRIMQRIEQLSNIYLEKETLVSRIGCSSDLGQDLTRLIVSAQELESSANLQVVDNLAQEIKEKNELNTKCRMW